MAKSLRENVGGFVFWTAFVAARGTKYPTIERWLDARAPSNCSVFDTPAQLRACGIPIVDAQKVDGAYHRQTKPVPATMELRVPRVRKIYKSMKALPVEDFPTMIYYNPELKKHQGKTIGTAAPSKVSKS